MDSKDCVLTILDGSSEHETYSNASSWKKCISIINRTISWICVVVTFIGFGFLWKSNIFFLTTHRVAPFQAFLQADTGATCSGVLFLPEYILTAAHCLYNAKKVSIFLGEDNIADKSSKKLELESKQFTIHPKYDPVTLVNDLAIIKVPEIPLSSSYIDVVQIPSSKEKSRDQSEYIGKLIKSFGWAHPNSKQGFYNFLQKKDLEGLEISNCYQAYPNDKFDNKSLLCLTAVGHGPMVCSGDSGGPILSNDGNNALIGIVSKGSGNCTDRKPVIGVMLDLIWMKNITKVFHF